MNNSVVHLLELDACELFRHVYNGELEIRDSKDLSLLFRRELRVSAGISALICIEAGGSKQSSGLLEFSSLKQK